MTPCLIWRQGSGGPTLQVCKAMFCGWNDPTSTDTSRLSRRGCVWAPGSQGPREAQSRACVRGGQADTTRSVSA